MELEWLFTALQKRALPRSVGTELISNICVPTVEPGREDQMDFVGGLGVTSTQTPHVGAHLPNTLGDLPIICVFAQRLTVLFSLLEPHKYATPQVTPFLRSRLSPELTSPRLQERGGPLLLAAGSETWLALWNECEWEGARSRGSPWLSRASL